MHPYFWASFLVPWPHWNNEKTQLMYEINPLFWIKFWGKKRILLEYARQYGIYSYETKGAVPKRKETRHCMGKTSAQSVQHFVFFFRCICMSLVGSSSHISTSLWVHLVFLHTTPGFGKTFVICSGMTKCVPFNWIGVLVLLHGGPSLKTEILRFLSERQFQFSWCPCLRRSRSHSDILREWTQKGQQWSYVHRLREACPAVPWAFQFQWLSDIFLSTRINFVHKRKTDNISKVICCAQIEKVCKCQCRVCWLFCQLQIWTTKPKLRVGVAHSLHFSHDEKFFGKFECSVSPTAERRLRRGIHSLPAPRSKTRASKGERHNFVCEGQLTFKLYRMQDRKDECCFVAWSVRSFPGEPGCLAQSPRRRRAWQPDTARRVPRFARWKTWWVLEGSQVDTQK